MPNQTAPLTPTPLSEAVARLKLFVAPEPSLRARVISMSLLQSDVALLLDAVAEGRENGRLIPVRYEIAGARSPFGRITRYVEQRRHRDGRTQWAVSDGAFVLATDGQWEYEPLPSNRGAAFLARTRYDSPADALAVYDASLPDSSAPAERERL